MFHSCPRQDQLPHPGAAHWYRHGVHAAAGEDPTKRCGPGGRLRLPRHPAGWRCSGTVRRSGVRQHVPLGEVVPSKQDRGLCI